MSDNIDYAELDRAVNEAIQQNSSVAPAKKAPAPTPRPVVAPTITSKQPVKARGQFIDFIRTQPLPAPKASSIHTIQPAPQRTAKKPVAKPVTPPAIVVKSGLRPARPVIPAPSTAATRPVARPVTKPAVKATAKPVARPVAKPSVAKPTAVKPIAKTAPKPAVKPVAKVASASAVAAPAKPAPKPAEPTTRPSVAAQIQKKQSSISEKVASRFKPISKKTTPAKPLANSKKAAASAPNANNYSLGVRSPFLMTNATVEKRPLGVNFPDSSTAALRSTKNVYSTKSPSRQSSSASKKHIVTESPKKSSGWIAVLIVVGIIVLGGLLGYGAFKLLFAN